MSLQIMASERRAAALLPFLYPFTAPLPNPVFLLFLPFCSSIPSLLPHLYSLPAFFPPLSLTLFILTPSTSLSSNVCPVCLTGGYRKKNNLSQGQMDSTNRLLQTVAPTLAAVLRRRAFYHIMLMSDLFSHLSDSKNPTCT